MRFLMLVASLVVAPTLVAEQGPRPDWTLQVGLFGYRPDGTIGVTAFETQLSSKSFVYIMDGQCGLGAGLGPHSRQATHAWSFSGKEIEVTPELAIIQLDWQRVIDNGQPTTTPGGSVQLTLKAGEHVTIDSVLPRHAVSCWSTVGFEARYRANPFPDAQLAVRPDGTSRAGGGGRVVPSGASSLTSPMAAGGSEGGGRPSVSGGTGGSASSSGSATSDVRVTTSSYIVHLWLVRSAPGKPEESQYRQVTIANARSAFSFAPITVDTARGPVSVTVGGSLDAAGTRGDHLLLLLHRNVPQWDGGRIYSESKLTIMPARDDVASVEMPPFRIGDQLFPDRLSLRVRVEPR